MSSGVFSECIFVRILRHCSVYELWVLIYEGGETSRALSVQDAAENDLDQPQPPGKCL